MVRLKTFRGKTQEELINLPLQSVLNLLTARARRAVKRALSGANPKFSALIRKVRKIKQTNPSKAIRTHVREAVILPEWIGLTFAVHSGKEFKPVQITLDKVGYRLGDFVHTTGRVLHSGPGIGATRGSKFIPLK
ncbi:MAG: ribosomal protein S19 family protein [Candidatus Anstonellales archaeon]